MRNAIGIVLVALTAFPLHAGDLRTPIAGVALKQQTSDQGGVTVTISPREIGDAKTWDFDVTLETHTRPLNDDMAQSAVLVSDGKRSRALEWEGDPIGGHHRKGVIRFPPVSPLPRSVEVQIRLFGDNSPRVFRWELAPTAR